MDDVEGVQTVLGTVIAVVGGVIVLAIVVLVIAAVISILLYRRLTAGGKLLWILLVLYLPILGSVAWFVVGKKGHINVSLGIAPGVASGARPGDEAAAAS